MTAADLDLEPTPALAMWTRAALAPITDDAPLYDEVAAEYATGADS